MEKNQIFGIKIFLVIFGLITYLLALVFAFINNVPTSVQTHGNSTANAAPGLFMQNIESFQAKYPNSANPAAWVFILIWPLIFLWNTCSAFYMLASLFLPTDDSPIKREPALIPIPSLILWIVCWASVLAWLFTYDREYFGASVFFLIVTAWSGYAMLGFSYKSYFSDILVLEENSSKMLWLVRILFHNGFAIFNTWLTCAWKVNFATVITYVDSRGIDKAPADLIGNITAEDAGTVVVSLLLLEILVWFVLENFVFEKYCRYTVTIYPTLIFVLTGIFVRGYVVPYSRNQALVLTGLIISCIAFVARTVLVIYRHKYRMRCA